jgi:hypothetical protein
VIGIAIMQATRRCSPKGNHGCGKRKPIQEFKSPKSHIRKLCNDCNKKYNDMQMAGREAKKRGRSDTGPEKGSAEHVYFCRVQPCVY